MATEQQLLTSFRLEGRWGLPGESVGGWVPGHLDFDPQTGIRLSTESTLIKPKSGPVRLTRHPVINGITRNGRRVTLLESAGGIASFGGLSGMFSMPGAYKSLFLIAGEHLASVDNATYRSVAVRYHNLEEFIGTSGLRVEGNPARLFYQDPEPFVSYLENFRIEIANHAFTTIHSFNRPR